MILIAMKKKSKYGMPPLSSRMAFEHNVYLVLEDVERAVENNDVSQMKNQLVMTVPHLEKVKYLPNRRVDLPTVNEMLRNQANTLNWVKSMIGSS